METLVNPNQVRSGLIIVCHHLLRFDECTRGTGEVSCWRNQMRRHMSILCDFPVRKKINNVNERFIKIFPSEVLAEVDNTIQKWMPSAVKTIFTNSRV